MRARLFIGCALALGACAGGTSGAGGGTGSPAVGSPGATSAPANYSVTVGNTFRLRVGESAVIGGASATVAFRGVTADSRCPTGTQCVQAGAATVELDVTTPQGPSSVTLDTDTRKETPLGSYILRLSSLTPSPAAGSNPAPSSYVATLCVCRE